MQLRTLARFTGDAEVKAAAQALEKKLADAEMSLVDLRLTGEGQDGVRLGPSSCRSSATWRAAWPVGTSDRRTSRSRCGDLCRQVRRDPALDAILSGDLAELNQKLRARERDDDGGA